MGIRLDTAELLALLLETLLYGIFLTLYFVVIALFWRNSRDKTLVRQRKFIVPVASTMLALATAHLIVDFVRILQAFVFELETTKGGAIAYYHKIQSPLYITTKVLYVLQTTLGDGFLIWRLYIVYGKKLKFAAPFLVMLTVNMIVGFVACATISRAIPGTTIFAAAKQWIATFFSLTMCINVLCTGTIVWRIWSRSWGRAGGSYIAIIAVIIESGALYTFSVLALLIAFLSGSDGQNAALDAVQPIVGIIFLLLILQIRLHTKTPTTIQSSTQSSHPSQPKSGSRSPFTPADSDYSGNVDVPYTMQPITVNIAKETETDYSKPSSIKVESLDGHGKSILPI